MSYQPPGYAPGQHPYTTPANQQVPGTTRTSAGRRAAAFLIDVLIQFTVVGALNALPFLGPLIALGLLGAHWYWEGQTGQTVGKMALKIYTVNEKTGQPIGGWPGIGRKLLHILDWLPLGAGYIVGLVTGQSFADMIIGTVVVDPADVQQGPCV